SVKTFKVDTSKFEDVAVGSGIAPKKVAIHQPFQYELWKNTNVQPQKQKGYHIVYVRVPNGNIGSHTSRNLIEKLKDVIA
ncbi:hypothetical protein, partial [Streptomyces scabiei]|uniref:hypothetical protein n=1 Tax=Streptomyces scabiei TaxID=1930 RepID=UPI0038F5DBCF